MDTITYNFTDGDIAGLMNILLPLLIFVLILLVINIVSIFMLFRKAGSSGWKSIIPIYNRYVMIELGFGSKYVWLMAGLFATSISGLFTGTVAELLILTSIISATAIDYGFIRRFTSTGVTIAALFFPFIVLPYLAFSKKVSYNKNVSYSVDERDYEDSHEQYADFEEIDGFEDNSDTKE